MLVWSNDVADPAVAFSLVAAGCERILDAIPQFPSAAAAAGQPGSFREREDGMALYDQPPMDNCAEVTQKRHNCEAIQQHKLVAAVADNALVVVVVVVAAAAAPGNNKDPAL